MGTWRDLGDIHHLQLQHGTRNEANSMFVHRAFIGVMYVLHPPPSCIDVHFQPPSFNPKRYLSKKKEYPQGYCKK